MDGTNTELCSFPRTGPNILYSIQAGSLHCGTLENMAKTVWHALSLKDVLGRLNTAAEGLNDESVEQRLAQYGPNKLVEEKRESPIAIFFSQFKSPLIAILVVAAGLSIVLREFIDAAIILAILFFNATVGFVQERRADTALRALQQLVQKNVVVLRNGRATTIDQEQLVPGDILIVETGDMLPADARILEHANLKVNESILTGEAEPVNKHAKKLLEKTSLPDRRNMLYRGTTVVYGRCRAVITETAMKTRYGSIVAAIQKSGHQETPIQQRFKRLSQSIGIAVLGLALLVIGLGVIQKIPFLEIILVGLSLAVSVIPEGLPIVVTVTLAIGMWRMAKRKAIVRKLTAVETLGSVNLIASDKTGTLTFGEMMVQRMLVGDREYRVTGKGYQRDGIFSTQGNPIEVKKDKDLIHPLLLGALCNNASVHYPEKDNEEEETEVIGDPTEVALVVAAIKAGLEPSELAKSHPRIGEIPFDSDKKYMMTVHRKGRRELVAVKGAPERILAMSSKIKIDGKVRKLTKEDKNFFALQYKQMAHASLRGIAVAFLEVPTAGLKAATRVPHEHTLTFVGLIGIRDAVREEAATTITVANQAGIGSLMITGDHRDTAVSVAKELSLLDELKKEELALAVIEGVDLDELSDEALAKRLPFLRVVARVSPEHKLRIVRIAKEQGNVVAVTGDGVNDAPMLVEGDIGIAVDEKSTDAAKDASDIILTDGNFATILAAIEEGRTIFANIRRVTLYLLSTNAVEAIIILMALSLTMPLPLLPIQILWLNVVTDTFLDVAIGTEPKHATIMHDGPNSRKEPIINRPTLGRLIFLTTIMVTVTWIIYRFALAHTLDLRYVYAMTLTSLVVTQWFNSFNVRSGRESVFTVGIFKNRWHLIALAFVALLHLAVLYIPPLTEALHLVPIDATDWILILSTGVSVFVLEEVRKYIFRHWRKVPESLHTPAKPVHISR